MLKPKNKPIYNTPRANALDRAIEWLNKNNMLIIKINENCITYCSDPGNKSRILYISDFLGEDK